MFVVMVQRTICRHIASNNIDMLEWGFAGPFVERARAEVTACHVMGTPGCLDARVIDARATFGDTMQHHAGYSEGSYQSAATEAYKATMRAINDRDAEQAKMLAEAMKANRMANAVSGGLS